MITLRMSILQSNFPADQRFQPAAASAAGPRRLTTCARRRTGWGLWLGPALVLALSGCVTRAPEPAVRPAPSALPAPAPAPAAASDIWQQPLLEFERQHRELAATAARQGDWAAAEEALDVVKALRPNDAEAVADMNRARQMAAAGSAQRLTEARAAQRQGEAAKAQRLFLDVLALSPDNAEAAQALRGLERERVQRQHLGQLSRNLFTRPPVIPSMARNAVNAGASKSELERATLLASQGETKEAIAVLQPLSTAAKPDPAARSLLADLHVKQAEELLPNDRAAAIAALQRSLQLEPRHVRATALLRALRGSSGSDTKSIPAAPAGSTRR